jgi:hypothetical protein
VVEVGEHDRWRRKVHVLDAPTERAKGAAVGWQKDLVVEDVGMGDGSVQNADV